MYLLLLKMVIFHGHISFLECIIHLMVLCLVNVGSNSINISPNTPLKFNSQIPKMTPSLKPEIHLFHRPIIFWALQPLDFGGCAVASYANPFFSASQTPFVLRLQYLPASDGRRGVFTCELCGSGTAPARKAARAPVPFTASYARLCGKIRERYC